MDIYTLSRAKKIQDNLTSLKQEKDIWEGAKRLHVDTNVFNGSTYDRVNVEQIDFKELKNRTLAYINSKIEELEKEFAEL